MVFFLHNTEHDVFDDDSMVIYSKVRMNYNCSVFLRLRSLLKDLTSMHVYADTG